jgi:hypothetical protein
MIDKKDIIIDRTIYAAVYSIILPLGMQLISGGNWKNTIMFILILFVVAIVFLLNTAEYYMTNFLFKDDRIAFDYRVTISDQLEHLEIDYNSINNFKFYRKNRVSNRFNRITINYITKLGKSENFNLKVKDTLQWKNIIAELEKQCTTRV